MSTNGVSIEFRNLVKDYGPKRALNDVSFSVMRGEIFGYVGSNGAGKTTTIKIMTGLIKPSRGDAIVCGHSILSEPLKLKSKIGYIPESGALFEKLTPREYLTSMGRLYRVSDYHAIEGIAKWLDFFSLSRQADQRIGLLSKGNKQKVCWIAALLHDPEVLILDEPLNGLDVEVISHIKELMADLAASGKTIFYSSHLIDVVEKVCSRVAILHAGSLIGVGTVDEVRQFFNADTLEEALMRIWQEQRAAQ
jgi:ABC-2 type transport system ATP-binding protein